MSVCLTLEAEPVPWGGLDPVSYPVSYFFMFLSLCIGYVSVTMGLFVNFFYRLIDWLIDWLTDCKAVTLKHCRADANLCLLHFTSSVCWHWCLLQCCPRLPPSDLCNCSRSSGEPVSASLSRASRRAPRWTQFMQMSRLVRNTAAAACHRGVVVTSHGEILTGKIKWRRRSSRGLSQWRKKQGIYASDSAVVSVDVDVVFGDVAMVPVSMLIWVSFV